MLFKTLITLGTALAFAAPTLPAHAQDAPAIIAAIKNSAQSYQQQIHSLSCKLTTTTALGASAPVQVEEGKWAFKGNKVINESHYTGGDPYLAGHNMDSVYLFNGSGGYQIRSENGGLANGHFTYANLERQPQAAGYWSPLSFSSQLDGQWLSEVLNGSNPTLEQTVSDPTFGQLYVIHLSLRGREEHIWFAPKYGNAAVKVVEGDPDNGAVYTSSHYKRYGDLWLPLQGDLRILTKQPNGQTIVQVDKSFVFSDIQVNTVPDAAFNYKWPTGATVYDNDKRTKYMRAASGKWVPMAKFQDDAPPVGSRPTALEVAAWLSLVCLAALFTLGLILRRRRTSA